MTTANHKLTVNIQNVIKSKAITYPIELTIRATSSSTGSVIRQESLNDSFFTADLPNGYYNLRVQGKGFKPQTKSIAFGYDQTVFFFLEDADDKYRIFAEIDNTLDTNYDYDLNLQMVAKDGTKCVVSAQTPICPDARYVQNIHAGEKGYEVIEISKFQNAYYMAYLTKLPNTFDNCPIVPSYFKPQAHRYVAAIEATKIWSSYSGQGANEFSNGQQIDYSEQAAGVFEPIRYGTTKIIPNLMSALSKSKA